MIQEAIDKQLPIHVRMNADGDEVFSGVCIKATSELMILVNFNPESFEYDGYIILPAKDAGDYRLWSDEELEEIANDISRIILGNWNWIR